MALTFGAITSATVTNNTTLSTANMAQNPVAGDVHLAITASNTAATHSISDTQGNTYGTHIGSQVEAGTGVQLDMWVAKVTGSGSNALTFGVSGGTQTFMAVAVLPLYGILLTTVPDGTGIAQDSGNSPTGFVSATNTTGNSVAIMVGYDLQDVGTNFNPSSGFSLVGSKFWTALSQAGMFSSLLLLSGVQTTQGQFLNTAFDRAILGMAVFNINPGVVFGGPQQKTFDVGGTVTLSSSATSPNGTITYQWQSAPITSFYANVPGTWADIGGATSATYTTPTLSSADSGTFFRCKGTDTLGTVISSPCRIFLRNTVITGKGKRL
jgi:hypothetical protein